MQTCVRKRVVVYRLTGEWSAHFSVKREGGCEGEEILHLLYQEDRKIAI